MKGPHPLALSFHSQICLFPNLSNCRADEQLWGSSSHVRRDAAKLRHALHAEALLDASAGTQSASCGGRMFLGEYDNRSSQSLGSLVPLVLRSGLP